MRRNHIRIPLGEEPIGFPGIPPTIKLTAEQQKQYDDYNKQQQDLWDQEQRQRELEDADLQGEKVTRILDMINGHPLIKELINLKIGSQESLQERYIRIALPAVITANPDMDAKAISDRVYKIANAIINDRVGS